MAGVLLFHNTVRLSSSSFRTSFATLHPRNPKNEYSRRLCLQFVRAQGAGVSASRTKLHGRSRASTTRQTVITKVLLTEGGGRVFGTSSTTYKKIQSARFVIRLHLHPPPNKTRRHGTIATSRTTNHPHN